ncbi:hypothetical protein GCM10010372_12260 [Streptomyces tauricus]|nr:hypothetical protein GCM10010372_12260 [Streptomyces tauricus]
MGGCPALRGEASDSTEKFVTSGEAANSTGGPPLRGETADGNKGRSVTSGEATDGFGGVTTGSGGTTGEHEEQRDRRGRGAQPVPLFLPVLSGARRTAQSFAV